MERYKTHPNRSVLRGIVITVCPWMREGCFVASEILAIAGLPKTRIHDLRHSAVAIVVAQGVNLKAISELLGNSSVELRRK